MHLITDADEGEPGLTKAVPVVLPPGVYAQLYGRVLRPGRTLYKLGDGNDGVMRIWPGARLLDYANFYRGFRISYDPPPIPTRAFDWHATHVDYDGPGDARHFAAESVEGCKHEIDIWYDEQEGEA